MAIIQDHDTNRLLSLLMKKGYRATKLASTGGFLREGNTTLLIGVDIAKVDEVIDIIRETCAAREQLVTSFTSLIGTGEEQGLFPLEIPLGGATVFVLDVERYVKF
jgi:uncharacterized protein YaaQ